MADDANSGLGLEEQVLTFQEFSDAADRAIYWSDKWKLALDREYWESVGKPESITLTVEVHEWET